MHRNVEGCSKCKSSETLERGELFLRQLFKQLGEVPMRPEQTIVAFGAGGVRRLTDVLRGDESKTMKDPGSGYQGHRLVAKAAEQRLQE